MNIKRVKEEIKNTIHAYLLKDSYGEYKIPTVRQRPILLMGPPGIGKTAIMEQMARECNIGLVSYTITHHTRQSAIGLPLIEKKEFNGKEYSITEYTMSEIIASVFNKIEETKLTEGILFIDEINCVSETLAPTMLQFLQGKTFGSHKVPKGWIIIAAGNPPEYNKSVREFDIVTLDRVKKIDVSVDYSVWKEYAYKQGIHGAILSYLEIKKENFYLIETTIDGARFVTARGWEDLSNIIQVYEQLNLTIDEGVIYQYIQHEKIAKDFANYLDLFYKYQSDYQMEEILKGNISSLAKEKLQAAPFDEKLSVVGLLLSKLSEHFYKAYTIDLYVTEIFGVLKKIQSQLLNPNFTPIAILSDIILKRELEFDKKRKAGLLDRNKEECYHHVIKTLEEYLQMIKEKSIRENDEAMEGIRVQFNKIVDDRKVQIEETKAMLESGFDFMEQVFSESAEMVIFVTELTANYYSMKFISDNGSESYYKYSKGLLFHETERDIRKEIEQLRNIMES